MSYSINTLPQTHNKCMAMVSLSATGLKSKDTFSKSDPFAVVFLRNRANQDSKFQEVGCTETIPNDKNPRWQNMVEFEYNLYDMQELKIALFDSDSSKQSLDHHDLIHEVTVTVAELLKQGAGVKTFKWRDDKSSLTVRYEKATSSNDTIRMDVKCKGLPKMDTFGKADPYFVIERLAEDGKTYIKSFDVEYQKKNLHPSLGRRSIDSDSL